MIRLRNFFCFIYNRLIFSAYLNRIIFNFTSMSIIHPVFRGFLLRALGCSLGPGARIMSSVFIGGRDIFLGKMVVLNVGCFLDSSCTITVGDFVRMGPYVRILTGTHSYANSVIRRGPGSKNISLPVVIERGCWIGMGAMIMPGVTVREGCVIAAGAVVNSSTQPNGLYAGVPAVRIKDLSVSDDVLHVLGD